MPIYINDGSHDSGSRHGGNNIVWTKGFRRVSLDGGKPLTRSQHFVGPRLFIKHYPDGRADEYVYADSKPGRVKLPMVIIFSVINSLVLPFVAKNIYEKIMIQGTQFSYSTAIIAAIVFVVILSVLLVRYLKDKDVIYEEIPADSDPRDDNKKYSGNLSGKEVRHETHLYREDLAPRRTICTVSLILMFALLAVGLVLLLVGMKILPAAGNGNGMFLMVMGCFWIFMSLIGIISSATSLVNANKMIKRLPVAPVTETAAKPAEEKNCNDDEDYKRMKRRRFE